MRVLMIDDHRLLAEAIRIALEANGFEVVGIEATAEAGMRALRDAPCDMALVDVGLPDESGIDLGRRILEELPGVRVVALTGFLDAASMDEAVGAGFHGYLTKDTPLTELVGYLRAVAEGQVVGPRRAMMTAFVDPRSAGEIVAERLAAQLTSREREVLTFLAEARAGDSIAEILSISANTVRTHVQNIMAKLEVHSRLEAVAFATRYRLVQPARTGADASLRVPADGVGSIERRVRHLGPRRRLDRAATASSTKRPRQKITDPAILAMRRAALAKARQARADKRAAANAAG